MNNNKYELFLELIRLSSKVKSNPGLSIYQDTIKSWSEVKIEKVCAFFDVPTDGWQDILAEFIYSLNLEQKIKALPTLSKACILAELRLHIEESYELLNMIKYGYNPNLESRLENLL